MTLGCPLSLISALLIGTSFDVWTRKARASSISSCNLPNSDLLPNLNFNIDEDCSSSEISCGHSDQQRRSVFLFSEPHFAQSPIQYRQFNTLEFVVLYLKYPPLPCYPGRYLHPVWCPRSPIRQNHPSPLTNLSISRRRRCSLLKASSTSIHCSAYSVSEEKFHYCICFRVFLQVKWKFIH